jgi:ribonuclease HI
MDIFSDGSSKMQNGVRAAGIGVYFQGPIQLRISEPIFCASNTNNEAEWEALAVLVTWAIDFKIAGLLVDCKEITFCIDSQYIFNAMTKWIEAWRQNNWKSSKKTAVSHLGYIKYVDKAMRRLRHDLGVNVRIQWVKAHSSEMSQPRALGNKEADLLAERGRNMQAGTDHKGIVAKTIHAVNTLSQSG